MEANLTNRAGGEQRLCWYCQKALVTPERAASRWGLYPTGSVRKAWCQILWSPRDCYTKFSVSPMLKSFRWWTGTCAAMKMAQLHLGFLFWEVKKVTEDKPDKWSRRWANIVSVFSDATLACTTVQMLLPNVLPQTPHDVTAGLVLTVKFSFKCASGWSLWWHFSVLKVIICCNFFGLSWSWNTQRWEL